MSCCRKGSNLLIQENVVNKTTECSKCKTELKELYYMSAAQQTNTQKGVGTILLKIHCPQCKTLNAYILTIDRK